ncbi:MAG: menaquinone biosynthesis decarboxylase [Alistipes sp.]|nr:menaquinone biosynthesis decarboxylase [Alistipes sp.]
MYKSLADYISRLESAGELVRIGTLVSSHEEIAEITDRFSKAEGGGKALLFEHTESGFPVLTNMMGSERRIALALGVESLDELPSRIDTLLKEALSPKGSLLEKMRMLPMLADVAKWFPKRINGRGACQQVVLMGEDADIERLPVLKCWPSDGGRFVTLPMVNTIDPDTGVRNVGMYRMQIIDGKTTGMHWHIHKTGARHYEGYKAQGRRMPVTVTLGGDPAYTFSATAPMPDNMDEYLLAGFLRKSPVRLVKSLTNDIWIPEDCDFVIEGYVDPAEEKFVEGPFGDHTGFYSLTDLYPRFHITAITHRQDAIYPATLVGIPPQEDAYIGKASEKIFLAPIRLAIQPEIEDMTMPFEGTAHNIVVISLRKRYTGQVAKVVQSLWGAGQMMFNKYMLAVPRGADVRNNATLAALLRRVDTTRNIIRSEGVYDVLDHATATNGYGGKLAIDTTDIDLQSKVEPYHLPEKIEPSDGVTAVLTDFAESWGVVAIFAEEGADIDSFIRKNGLERVNYIAIFDAQAAELPAGDLVWLGAANSDPRRDVRTLGRTLIVDVRSKRPGAEGNPSRFPNVVTASQATIELVDSRWEEYNCGEFLPSPSRRYRRLLLSESEQWE